MALNQRRPGSRHRQEGYNLVALMVIVAVVNIGIAASLPVWSKVIQRDKEGELIFRGLQYAEAIRVFQKRTGRFPTSLEELIEIEPRCIRQLWLDPMNDEPEWGLILAQGQGGLSGGRELGRGTGIGDDSNRNPQDRRNSRQERRRRRDEERDRRRSGREQPGESVSPRQRIEDPGGGRRGIPSAGQQVTRGPIIGVHSLNEDTAIRKFDGGASYKDWKFTADLLPEFGVENAGENVPRLHSNWIGRAFPVDVEVSTGIGGMPDSVLDRERDRRKPANQRNQPNRPKRR